jgi:prenyltransferase beta subunit
MSDPTFLLGRRTVLKQAAALGAAAVLPWRNFGQVAQSSEGARRVVTDYLETLARPDGGYAWGDQERSHLTPTFGVIGAYHVLSRTPPRRDQLADYVRRNHPREIKKLEQERRIFDFQQVQALAWLGADLAEFRPRIAALTQPMVYLKQYERKEYPIFQSEVGVVMSHALLGLPMAGLADAFGRYIDARRRPNGSYNNTPAADDGDGHVMNTLWALQARKALGHSVNEEKALVAWLRACQRSDGGFTWQPTPEFGGVDDVAYTRAAVKALALLGAEPANRAGCIAQVLSLANADGGFGDRPGWASNATATYYALDALATLGALDGLAAVRRRTRPTPPAVPAGLRVWSLQLQSHGQGSPAEAVDLARSLQIHLWGAKNAKPEWLARARELAAAQRVPVRFFVANEEYGTWVHVPGLGTYSHTSDLFAPGDTDIGPSLATAGPVTWPEFRVRRLAGLERGRGRLFWQFGENEELVRLFLDDSVERGGYAAISTYHFGNPDFMNTEPFLNRWRGRIPFVSIQDAHGPEPWWFADQTTGFRTLFLATEPTWDGWLEALRRNWVVAVRRDVWTKGATWMHAGSDEVRDYVRAREEEWRWWNHAERTRPMVSLVVVSATDTLEPARPESGAMLRVRCAWENTPQGLLKAPLSELVRIEVDGRAVTPALVSPQRANGLRTDHHHRWPLASLTAGRHRATAVVRVLATETEFSRSIEFEV